RFWVGAIVDGEKRVSHADFGNYEWHPTPPNPGETRPDDVYFPLGMDLLEAEMVYDDLLGPHTTEPLNVQVFQAAKVLPYGEDEVLTNSLLIEQRIVNIGEQPLNDLLISWVFDCDVGTGFDQTNPHMDDLVDYDGWDGPDSDSDLEDIVENLDWNGNDELDGYDEYGIPYGWQYLGSQEFPNPNYDLTLIVPDGFPDEFQVVVTDSDTVVVSRMMSYMYDGDDPMTPGDDTREGGGVPGFIGLRLISSPTGNVFSHQWWNWEDDPGSDQEKYDYMAADHESSMGYRFIPHPFTLGSPTFDYRFMLTTGPFFGFASGDTIRTIVGAVLGTGIRGLRQNADSLILALDSLGTVLGVERPHAAIPDKLTLHQNYPNPFNPTTTIEYDLPEQVDVVLTIYDILGREVRKWQWQKQEAGYYSVTWDGTNYHGKQVGAGVYLYRVQARQAVDGKAGNYTKVRKMVLLK
ncbi:MAG: FlgD immunoglobulin-like domain containing protein, partial [Fidelibacterota bacterium]